MKDLYLVSAESVNKRGQEKSGHLVPRRSKEMRLEAWQDEGCLSPIQPLGYQPTGLASLPTAPAAWQQGGVSLAFQPAEAEAVPW
jgi:hypothetical protein